MPNYQLSTASHAKLIPAIYAQNVEAVKAVIVNEANTIIRAVETSRPGLDVDYYLCMQDMMGLDMFTQFHPEEELDKIAGTNQGVAELDFIGELAIQTLKESDAERYKCITDRLEHYLNEGV